MSYVGVHECAPATHSYNRWRINVSFKEDREAICPKLSSTLYKDVLGQMIHSKFIGCSNEVLFFFLYCLFKRNVYLNRYYFMNY